jgi:hypothetical protein
MRAPPPPWRRAATLVAVLALLTPGQLPGQAADPDLTTGLRQVSEGDYEGAVVTLDAVARRLAGDKSRRRDLIEAYVNLGVALVALDQRTPGKERFRLALALDPKLELSSDRYSPKVLGVFAEARRDLTAEAAAAKTEGSAEPKTKGGSSKLPFILLGTAGAAAGGIALATKGGGSSGDGARFVGAAFEPPVVECPNGDIQKPLKVFITVFAEGGRSSTMINSVNVQLRIEESPLVPSEIGFASGFPATISPASVPAGSNMSLKVETSILCSNAVGDTPRYNRWSGHLILSTADGLVNRDTATPFLQVNIP